MTWHLWPLSRRAGLPDEWTAKIRIRGRVVYVHVARILRADIGRLRYAGWYAHTFGCGGDLRRAMAYYHALEDRFGSDVHGVRGYGRTREEAVMFLRRALRNGWLASGERYAPPQFNCSYTSEYDL